MSTTCDYGVFDVSHVAMFSNFGGTCVSDNLRLGLSAGYRSLDHHDVNGYGGPNIGHLVKLYMEARLAGRRGQIPEVMVFQSTRRHNVHCPFLLSVVMVLLM